MLVSRRRSQYFPIFTSDHNDTDVCPPTPTTTPRRHTALHSDGVYKKNSLDLISFPSTSTEMFEDSQKPPATSRLDAVLRAADETVKIPASILLEQEDK